MRIPDTTVDACRLAVAKYQRLRRSPVLEGAVRLYWCEGLGRPLGKSLALRWRGRSVFAQNFGDSLSPLVVSLLSGRPVTYALGPRKLIAVGSVFFGLRDHDVVWGAGLGRPEEVGYALKAKNVAYSAVRGPRTWQLLRRSGIDCPQVFGDPASVLPLYMANDVPPTVEIGIVPHWTQFSRVSRALAGSGVQVIDVLDDVNVVARQILSCRLIFTSSLHGLIFAEAYGIPAMLVAYEDTRNGELTKFADYFESTDRDLFVRRLAQPRDIFSLVREFARVPSPRFSLGPLLEAFPLGAIAAPARPVGAWSSGV